MGAIKLSLLPLYFQIIKKRHRMLQIQIDEKRNKIFAPLKNEWLHLTPEERVRQSYICTLVNEYGYDLRQMAQEVKVNNSLRGQGKARADIVIWKSEQDKIDRKHAIIVVECKAESVKLQRADFYQGANYAAWSHATFLVCLNLKELKIFKTEAETMPDEFLVEIVDIPKAKDISNEARIKALLDQKKTFSKTEFQTLLVKCHNIFRDDDALAPDAAFDEISKILFMKINYERNRKTGEEEKFSKKLFEQKEKWFEEEVKPNLIARNPLEANTAYLDFWFDETKRKYANEKLFEPSDKMRIGRDTFLKVVKELEAYNLSDTDDDIKGVAFEEFLSKTFRGKGLGQFFTPRTIVKFITDILDPQEGELICDPCCGSGGFLIYAFEYIKARIEKDIENAKTNIKQQLLQRLQGLEKLNEADYEKIENEVNTEIETVFTAINRDLDNKTKGTRLHQLSFECIYGTDKEARSARMAKMNMIMHGDGHGGVHQYEGLANVNGISDSKFDVILTNPPFGSRVAKDVIHPNFTHLSPNDEHYYLAKHFDVSEYSTLKEVMFADRCLNLLKAGGRMGIVLPEGFLNNSQLQNAREYFEGRAKILLIVSIPQDVFIAAGATVKPSLVFLRKFTDAEEAQYNNEVQKATQEIDLKYAPDIALIEESIKKAQDELKHQKAILEQHQFYFKQYKFSKKQKEEQMEFVNSSILRAKNELDEVKREAKKQLAEIAAQKTIEIKALVKNRFDYPIPVAQVEKAGINSTGNIAENELDDVAQEFKQYRTATQLWQNNTPQIAYQYDQSTQKLYRITNEKKELING